MQSRPLRMSRQNSSMLRACGNMALRPVMAMGWKKGWDMSVEKEWDNGRWRAPQARRNGRGRNSKAEAGTGTP